MEPDEPSRFGLLLADDAATAADAVFECERECPADLLLLLPRFLI